jgi:hypothetical protein
MKKQTEKTDDSLALSFGFSLSYTTVSHGNLRLTQDHIVMAGGLVATAEIGNTGQVANWQRVATAAVVLVGLLACLVDHRRRAGSRRGRGVCPGA